MTNDIFDNVFIDPLQVKKVAIIGGGASGSIVLDSLIKEEAFTSITLFERKEKYGGVWCLDEDTVDPDIETLKPGSGIRHIDPPLENPFLGDLTDKNEEIKTKKSYQYRFSETPCYSKMKTNVAEKYMTFSDAKKWPGGEGEDTTYVDRSAVEDYIREYILRNKGNQRVRLETGTTVEDVERIYYHDHEKKLPYYYRLTVRKSDEEYDTWRQEDFDSIIVATGHYHIPFIPEVEGTERVRAKFPEKIKHAKFFRNPEIYSGKKVILIGSRASGADLSRLICKYAEDLYQSIRSPENTRFVLEAPNLHTKPEIKSYEASEASLKVNFEDGTSVSNPDFIIYCTGYSYSYPFLRRLLSGKKVDSKEEGVIVPNTFQHTFCIQDPLISFVGIPVDGVSFRVFEYQAILVSRFLSGKIKLPSIKEQEEWCTKRLREKGLRRAYHTIGASGAYDYIHELIDLGKVDPNIRVGREFPSFSSQDVEQIKRYGENLAKVFFQR